MNGIYCDPLKHEDYRWCSAVPCLGHQITTYCNFDYIPESRPCKAEPCPGHEVTREVALATAAYRTAVIEDTGGFGLGDVEDDLRRMFHQVHLWTYRGIAL